MAPPVSAGTDSNICSVIVHDTWIASPSWFGAPRLNTLQLTCQFVRKLPAEGALSSTLSLTEPRVLVEVTRLGKAGICRLGVRSLT